MTVGELLAALAGMDPATPVLVGYDGCVMRTAARVDRTVCRGLRSYDPPPEVRTWEEAEAGAPATEDRTAAQPVVVLWSAD
jgi:hypothetical protein